MATSPSICARQLTCIRQQHTLFDALSFELHSGEALFIEGPNGSGKSSLLRLLAGIATPVSGEVLWCSQSILDHRDIFQLDLHYVGHTNGLKLGLTVGENLAQMGTLSETCRCDDDTLEHLKLSNLTNTLAKHLSAGQRRRLALARLLLFPKKLWLLDEPLTALDVDTQTFFLEKMDQHLGQGGIVITSSHHVMKINRPVKTLRLPLC